MLLRIWNGLEFCLLTVAMMGDGRGKGRQGSVLNIEYSQIESVLVPTVLQGSPNFHALFQDLPDLTPPRKKMSYTASYGVSGQSPTSGEFGFPKLPGRWVLLSAMY